jgi:hypothetical protein
MATCHPWKGRRRGPWCRCRHGRMMSAFELAYEVWWNDAEAATSLYATELAEWRADNPVPQLGDYMKGTF